MGSWGPGVLLRLDIGFLGGKACLIPSRPHALKPSKRNGRRAAAVATSRGRGSRLQRRREPPDELEDLDGDEDPELGRLDPDDRAPDDLADGAEDERDGARADDDDLPDGDTPRTDGERVYGDPDPMFRLGRVGEVRGTMTGRDELADGLERPTPTRGVTGCRTRGEDELRVLGRDDDPRALGREE